MLPARTRGLLDAKSVERSNLISFMLGKQHDECDVPYTEWELDAALARVGLLPLERTESPTTSLDY